MLSLKFLVGFAIGLVALVNAIPVSEDGLERVTLQDRNMSDPDTASTLGYDPSFDYHDYSMVQAWMGKSKVTVGTVTGTELFNEVYKALDESCPSTGVWGHCGLNGINPKGEIRAKCHLPSGASGVISCVTSISSISAMWQSEPIRHSLMTAVAGFLGAVTTQGTDSTNCWEMPHMDGKKACNVGDVVRVNFPDWQGRDGRNYMHITLRNAWTGYGNYECCKEDGLKQMDKVLDSIEASVRGAIKYRQQDKFRDSRCIINGWATCPLS